MRIEDTTFIEAGVQVHMVYRDAAGEVTERVAWCREVLPDGSGFRAFCLRRCAEGAAKCGRDFLFERIIWARAWDGAAIRNFNGFSIIADRAAIMARVAEMRAERRGAVAS